MLEIGRTRGNCEGLKGNESRLWNEGKNNTRYMTEFEDP